MLNRAIAAMCLLIAPICASATIAAESQLAETTSGHAYAEVKRAVRKDGVLHVEVQFTTDYAGYAGELIYEDLPSDRIDGLIYVEFGDQAFPLLRESGDVAAPDELRLSFNYDPQKNPRVGSWEADFVAPTHDIHEGTLFMPNVDPIGPFPIRDR